MSDKLSLTNTELMIFLSAMRREEEVCKKVDDEWNVGEYECSINLVDICHEIVRKVNSAYKHSFEGGKLNDSIRS